jgi:photosystem II stability/assembly factor-like uncharacterized protein
MRLAAGLLILVLAIAAAGAFVAVNTYVHRSIPVRTHPGPVSRMCSQGVPTMPITGWPGTTAISDVGAISNVGPGSPILAAPNVSGEVKGGYSSCVLDAGHSWITVATGNPNCPGTPPCAGPQVDHVVVMSTRDSGQTWQQSQPIPASGSSLAAELDFVDDMHGWLLLDSGYYSSPSFVRTLYATSDGGLHWNRLASGTRGDGSGFGPIALGCAESGIMFLTPDRGWLTWDCSRGNGPGPQQTASAVVAATDDGGRSWTPVAALGTCGATPPIFSGSHGVLVSQCGIYWTADSGKTWNAGQALPFNARPDFIDGATGFYFQQGASGSDLYRTDDSGRDWTVVRKGLFPGDTIDSYQFIEANTGFANTTKSPATWKTMDGGKTWVLPAAYRSVGNVVCPLPWNPPVKGSAPVPVKMVSATTGWAYGALRTTDGGSHWTSAGPAVRPDRSSGHGEFFLDGTHAWVAQAVGSPTACADSVVIFSTADGGRTWQQASTIHTPYPDPTAVQAGTWFPSVDFLDAQNGWLLAQASPYCTGMGCEQAKPGPLYKTSDAGRHWTLVTSQAGLNGANCRAGLPIYFSSVTTAWLECSDGSVLVTRDGGSTWAVQVLVQENCCETLLPVFLDVNHGIYFESSASALLMTSDGGVTWSSRGLPPLATYSCAGKYGPTTCSNDIIPDVSFISPSEGWAIVGTGNQDGSQFTLRTEHTVNGGQTWAVLNGKLPTAPSSAFPNAPLATLSFVDASDGFWWIPASDASAAVFYRTNDGGQSWTAVQMTAG